MTEKIQLRVGYPPKNKAKNWPISATPENLPFFKGEIYQLLFLITVAQTYQNENAHILLCKMYKNSLKLHNKANLQALTLGRVKKITLY